LKDDIKEKWKTTSKKKKKMEDNLKKNGRQLATTKNGRRPNKKFKKLKTT
jgi:hypothetical protein